MSDYGHDLAFGAFLTPAADDIGGLVELAQLAEVRGLDVVSLQDHPYQPKHVDTWTMLALLGGQTSAVRLVPNVISLPLRPPVMLAKSAASLDLATGGRVELGLGAGAFWDPIEAAGGPRRTPKQAVDAVIEAINLIREFWAGGSVRFAGEYYRAVGLRAGPEPAHPIPIWLGAYGPRMLRVTGQLADAWVPTLGYADPPALSEMNERIDEAAVAAGRGPEQIRRIYNVFGSFGTGGGFLRGTVANWTEQLTELALRDGISTFLLGSDDPGMLRRFADEVVPAVREQVTKERADPSPTAGAPAGSAVGPAAGSVAGSVGGEDAARGGSGGGSDSGAADLAVLRPTVDSGERFSTQVPWDESTRPTLGESETAYPPERLSAPQHLIDVHNGLRSELGQLRDLVSQVRQGHLTVGAARSVINTMTMRQNNWTLGAYCESYCRIVTSHHTLEDRSVFPHLRRSEAGVGTILNRLEEEHEVIADLLDELDRALVNLVGGDNTGQAGQRALEQLQQRVDLLTDALLSHLAYEERELIGPLARHGFN